MAVTICQFVSYLFSANICVFNKSGKEKDSATENNSHEQKGVDRGIEECDIVCIMAEKLEIGDKIFRLEPKLAPFFGYYKQYPFLKRLYRRLRGRPTRKYVSGLLDAIKKETRCGE